MTIGIIGMGWVGASVAISTLHGGLTTELLLNDARGALAEGEALDLAHGASFYPPARVRTASVAEMQGADAVVIAAGRGGRANQTRLELLRDNAATIRSIAGELRGLKGTLIVVTNPVDVMTRIAAEASGLPVSRVIGTGTMLDTARLRRSVADRLHIDPRAVHAHVVGEHGDSEVVLWSSAAAGGRPLDRWPEWNETLAASTAEQVRRAAYEIIARKGATNHAIGLVTAALMRSILRDERRVLTVSTVQQGACDVRDVAISLPSIVGRGGAEVIVEPVMNDAEQRGYLRSAGVLDEAYRSLTPA